MSELKAAPRKKDIEATDLSNDVMLPHAISFAVTVALDLGLLGTAVEIITEAQPLLGENYHYRACYLSTLICMKKYDEAEVNFDESFDDEERKQPLMQLMLGAILAGSGRLEEAVEVYSAIQPEDDPEITFRAQELAKLTRRLIVHTASKGK